MGAVASGIQQVAFDIKDLSRVVRLDRHYAPWDELTEQTHLQLVKQPRLIKAFDWYGGKYEQYPDPADLPHTCGGCCCSIFLFIILAFLAANTGVQAVAREDELNFGPLITLHLDCVNEVLNKDVKKKDRKIPTVNDLTSEENCLYVAEMDALDNPGSDFLLRWSGTKGYNPSWDIPVLNLTLNYTVDMFSATATLGAIEVFDEEALARGHNQDSFLSTLYEPGGWEEVPVVRAASERLNIPIDTVADIIPPIPLASVGPHATSFPIRTIRDQQELFRDTYDSGRWSNQYAEIAPMFSNHTAYAFFRFDESQLEKIKSCQLEVGIINKDLFDLLNSEPPDARAGSTRMKEFQFINTSSSTWDPEIFTGPGGFRSAPLESTLIRLSAQIADYDLLGELRGFLNNANYYGINVKERARNTDDPTRRGIVLPPCKDPGGYWCRIDGQENWKEEALASVLDGWGIFVNYVHNANVTVTEMTCDGKTMGAEVFAERFDVARIRILRDGLNATATSLNVKPGFTRVITRPTPFDVLLAGPQGMERVTVISVDQTFSRFRIRRTNPIDFTSFVDAPIPATPPPEWKCAATAYQDGKTCDCRCGAPDPDCTNPARPAQNCAPGEVCGPLATCTIPQALAQVDGDTIFMSEGCSSLVFRRDTVSLFAGETTCPECHGSPQPFMSSAPDRDLVCRAVPQGFVDSREVPELNTAGDPATSRSVRIRTHPDGAPFPTSARRLQEGAAEPPLVISAGAGNSEEVSLSGGVGGVFTCG
jgi:hypothetical protein